MAFSEKIHFPLVAHQPSRFLIISARGQNEITETY